jgi:hypothetical protein
VTAFDFCWLLELSLEFSLRPAEPVVEPDLGPSFGLIGRVLSDTNM